MTISNLTTFSVQALVQVTSTHQGKINYYLHMLLAVPIAIITLYYPLSYVMLAIMSVIGAGMFFVGQEWRSQNINFSISHPVALSLIFLSTIYITALTQEGWGASDLRKLEDMTWTLFLLGIIPLYRRWGSRDTFWWGVIGCAILSGCVAIYEVYHLGFGARVTGIKGKPIMFGDIAMMASAFSVLAAIYFHKRGFHLSLIASVAAALGLFASIQSGTRGAWLFAPVFVVILIFLIRKMKISFWRPLFFIIPLAIFAVPALIPTVSSRINIAVQQVSNYVHEKPNSINTSIGQRFEMWRAGLTIFTEHPLTGVGISQLNNYFKEKAKLDDKPLLAIRNHAHNEYLNTLISRGLIGFAGLITLLLGSLFYFYWHLKRNPMIAFAGITLITGYATFGLTDSIFFFKFSWVFFFVCLYLLSTELSQQDKSQDIPNHQIDTPVT